VSKCDEAFEEWFKKQYDQDTIDDTPDLFMRQVWTHRQGEIDKLQAKLKESTLLMLNREKHHMGLFGDRLDSLKTQLKEARGVINKIYKNRSLLISSDASHVDEFFKETKAYLDKHPEES